jgi:hypothetical protein
MMQVIVAVIWGFWENLTRRRRVHILRYIKEGGLQLDQYDTKMNWGTVLIEGY